MDHGLKHEQLGQNGAVTPSLSSPDPEVKPKATRRTFTAQQKLKILKDTDGLEQGEIGSYLRRRGLYWSNLSKWRQQRDEGLLAVMEPKKRGCPPRSPEVKQIADLERENGQLRKKLDRPRKSSMSKKNSASYSA